MTKDAIVTDSVASIPDSITRDLNIRWVPFYVHIGNEALRDLIDIDSKSFHQWLPKAKELLSTANPSSYDYEKVYVELVESGVPQIISIHITSYGSGAYQAATIAKNSTLERIPYIKIEVIDSINVAMCQGWMVIEAARAAMKGATFESIISIVRSMIPNTHMLQTADTLKYLYMGVRIGNAKNLMGSLLKNRPIISMRNGVIVSTGQARSRKKTYLIMNKKIRKMVGSEGKIKIAYIHANAIDEIDKIRRLAEERILVVESLISELPPTLGVHTGPGTAGLCYYSVMD